MDTLSLDVIFYGIFHHLLYSRGYIDCQMEKWLRNTTENHFSRLYFAFKMTLLGKLLQYIITHILCCQLMVICVIYFIFYLLIPQKNIAVFELNSNVSTREFGKLHTSDFITLSPSEVSNHCLSHGVYNVTRNVSFFFPHRVNLESFYCMLH